MGGPSCSPLPKGTLLNRGAQDIPLHDKSRKNCRSEIIYKILKTGYRQHRETGQDLEQAAPQSSKDQPVSGGKGKGEGVCISSSLREGQHRGLWTRELMLLPSVVHVRPGGGGNPSAPPPPGCLLAYAMFTLGGSLQTARPRLHRAGVEAQLGHGHFPPEPHDFPVHQLRILSHQALLDVANVGEEVAYGCDPGPAGW